MRTLFERLKDNSLTIVLFVLFIACLYAQSVSGWTLQNQKLLEHGREAIGCWEFLHSSSFIEDLASNWQAAILQLATLIALGKFLYQRGAPHSLIPGRAKRGKFRKERQSGNWLYRNSLSLAFLAMFALCFAVHIVFGADAYNEERSLSGEPPISTASFMLSAKFWSSTTQTWQAEYLAIGLYVLLSVFLRQQGSPESKPVESHDDETGEANK